MVLLFCFVYSTIRTGGAMVLGGAFYLLELE